MLNKKPDQIIDEITGRVYPPEQAVIPQLTTIRAIIPPTIEMYQETCDIHTIMPNLDMISRAVSYLRGAPFIEIPDPDKPEETPHPLDPRIKLNTESNEYLIHAGWDETSASKVVTINIIGNSLISANDFPELFLTTPEYSVTASIKIPVEVGKTYHIVQINPALEFYKDDPNVKPGINNDWVKQKDYHNDDEEFEYAFVLPEGKNIVSILVYCLEDNEVIADYHIATELDFVKPERYDENDQG